MVTLDSLSLVRPAELAIQRKVIAAAEHEWNGELQKLAIPVNDFGLPQAACDIAASALLFSLHSVQILSLSSISLSSALRSSSDRALANLRGRKEPKFGQKAHARSAILCYFF